MGKSKELAELGDVVTQDGGNVLVGASTSIESGFKLQVTGDGGSISFVTPQHGNSLRFKNSNTTTEWSFGTNSPGVQNAGDYMAVGRYPSGGSWSEYMRIDASGRVTTPYQPAFHAMASDGNNISSGTIPYGNITFNRGGHYNTSTSRFTAPVAGAYQFHASCYSHNGTGFQVGAKIAVNGVMRQIGEVYEVGGNFGWDGINMSVIVWLNAGDYVAVEWRNGAQLHVNPNNNSFSGALIG